MTERKGSDSLGNEYPEEREVLPGIYMTDFRKRTSSLPKNPQSQSFSSVEKEKEKKKLTQEEILELHELILHKERIIVKLLKTNKEIEEMEKDATEKDNDLQQALKDNLKYILGHSDDIKQAKYQLYISGNYLKEMMEAPVSIGDDIPIPELAEIPKMEEEKNEEQEGEEDDTGIFL